MAIELAHAYISIIPETSKIAPGVYKALGGVEKSAEKSGTGMGGKIAAGMGGALKKASIGVGAAAGAALGAGLTKGIGRLNSIEQAEAKLKGLGHSAQAVGGIMESSLAAVKGTAFGLEEAASSAAGLVAAGIKPGKELEQVLKTVGDTATIAGTNMQDMGTIFGSVAARGKLQGDDMLQLLSRGVPVLQLLAEETGKTSAEISDMVSKGQIDFATFERAMRRGMGGAALEAGKTVQGAFKNMGAAAGRLGATLAGPFFKQAAGGLNAVTSALDAMDAGMKPVMANVDKWMTGTAVPAFQRFGTAAKVAFSEFKNSATVDRTAQVFRSLGQTAADLWPALVNIGAAVGKATAALGVGTWNVFLTTLEGVGAVAQALAPALQAISGFMADHPAIVAAAVAAWTGFKQIPGILDKIKPHVANLQREMAGQSAFVKAVAGDYRVLAPEIGRTGAAMKALGNNSATIRSMQNAFIGASTTAQGFGNALKAGVAPVLSKVKSGVNSLIGAFGGPWGVAITGAIALISNERAAAASTQAAHEQLSRSVREGAEAQRELQTELAGTTGELSENGLAAAAKIAKASLAEFNAEGSRKLSLVENINQATVGIDQFINKIPGMATEAELANTQMTASSKETRAAYDALKKTASDMGYSMEEVNSIVAEGGPAYDQLVASLRSTGEEGNRAAGQLQQARKAVEDSVNAARDLDPAFASASQAIDVLADSSSSADDKLSALNQIMQAMGLAPKNAEQAMMDAAEAIDQVAASAGQGIDASAGLGSALFDMSGKLDPANANARALHDSLSEMSDQLKNVAVNGGDVQGTFDMMQPALQELAQQFGLTEEQMAELLTQFGLVPEDIQTLINLQGADEATQDAMALKAAIENNPDAKSIEIRLHDEASRKKLEDLGFKLEQLPNGNTKVNVADEEAKAKLNGVAAELGKVNSKTAKPVIDANTAPADAKLQVVDGKLMAMNGKTTTSFAVLNADGLFATADFATAQLLTLDLQRPFPWADLDISSLNAKHIQALQECGLLDGQTPTPQANMNINQLTGEQQAALAQIFDLDAQRPTPLANLNKNELDAKANTASQRLKTLAAQHTEPKVTANTADAMNKLGSVLSRIRSIPSSVTTTIKSIFVNEHRATGGILGGTTKRPGYATGGRLSPGMPGAHTTDGVLGVDEFGMPTARVDAGEWIINRRSSSKYNGLLDAINRDDPRLQKFKGMLPGYADGGIATPDEIRRFVDGESVNGHQARRPLQGAPYDWGGINWGDCSGAMSAIARFAVGIAPFAARFTTMTEAVETAKLGFKPGKGSRGDLRLAWYNGGAGGGHTWGELPDGTPVEMRGGGRGGIVGGDAWTIDNGKATDFAHLPVKVYQATTTMHYGEDGAYEYGNVPVDAAPVDWSDETTTTPTASASTAGDEYIVPLSPEASKAADTIESNEPGLLGGSSTWSDFGGSVVAAAVSGQIADVLGVFGIPDELPPIVKAGQAWYQAAREANQNAAGFVKAEADVIKAANAVDEAKTSGAVGANGEATPEAAADAIEATDAAATAVDSGEVAKPTADWGPDFFAYEIARAAKDMGLGADGAKIGVATALVESGDPMRMWANNAVPESLNYRHDAVGSDHDSVGLFQQRDNGAWGTVEQRMDPYESAKLFFTELKKLDWQNMDPGAAAQAVQRSAFPDRYATKMDRAKAMVEATRIFAAAATPKPEAKLYDRGGWLPHGGVALNLSKKPEPILTNDQWKQLQEFTDSAMGSKQEGPKPEAKTDGETKPPVEVTAPQPEKKQAVQTFDVDPGALQNTINGALPMLMEQTSWADIAKLTASSVVSFAGRSALAAAGTAAAAPLAAAAGSVPGMSAVGGMVPVVAENVGGLATDAAAWYAGEVAWGVTNAFEQYSKDLVGTSLLPLQDVIGVLKTPIVGDLAATAGINIPGATSFRDYIPEPLQKSAPTGGDVYNFIAQSREGMYSDFRREMAKNNKGVVGAR